jgi:hypothetical protein
MAAREELFGTLKHPVWEKQKIIQGRTYEGTKWNN